MKTAVVDSDGLNIEMHDNVFSFPKDIFDLLEKEIEYLPIENTHVFIKGNVCKIPRRVAAFGTPGLSYTFSGLRVACEPWTELLLEIKSKVEELSGSTFNFVLVNRYNDGYDCIGQHKDNEHDLLENHPIVSVSLGETRKMIFKRPDYTNYSLELKDNSVLIMKNPTNTYWSHGIPRQPERNEVRISLTFRRMNTCKRKNQDTLIKSNKKMKKEYVNSQSRGFFNTEDIPDGIYNVGDNVFLTRNVYRQKSVIHLRRYRIYGQRYYPTKEGVTMDLHEFDKLMRSAIPQQLGQLFEIDDRLGYALDINSVGENTFKLTKRYDRPYGEETTTSIVITSNQWEQMKNHHIVLMELLIDDWLLSCKFKDTFVTWCKMSGKECQLQTSTPDSWDPWDLKLGTMQLDNILKSIITDLLISKGGLITPEMGVGEVIRSNEVKDFNSALKDLNFIEMIENFYLNVTDENSNEPYLLRRMVDYLTLDYLDSKDLTFIINEVRSRMCPLIGPTSICV